MNLHFILQIFDRFILLPPLFLYWRSYDIDLVYRSLLAPLREKKLRFAFTFVLNMPFISDVEILLFFSSQPYLNICELLLSFSTGFLSISIYLYINRKKTLCAGIACNGLPTEQRECEKCRKLQICAAVVKESMSERARSERTSIIGQHTWYGNLFSIQAHFLFLHLYFGIWLLQRWENSISSANIKKNNPKSLLTFSRENRQRETI